ncbi:MAG: hypothetical protein Q4F49_05360 [Pseudoxanthomonas suwonensis]|nr:hypothetical protein [Pseudoxanthomonas suwonensis]
MHMTSRWSALSLVCLLVACGGNEPNNELGDASPDGSTEALPTPRGAAGSVTGMPEAGQPGSTGIELGGTSSEAASAATDPSAEATGDGLPPLPDPLVGGDAGNSPDADGGPLGRQAAVQLLDTYYTRLNARDVEAARGMWRGQDSPLQLLPPDVISVVPRIGNPGRIDAGAGQRYVEVPVTLEQTLTDGTTRQASGVAVLQGSMVEGAEPGWHISAIRMR